MTRRAAVLTLAGLLAACAPKGTSLVTSWREPTATPQQFQKVLVLFFAPHESQRQFGESELVRLMTRTKGVAGYTLLTPEDIKDVAKVKAVMAREGFDGAVAMRFVETSHELSRDSAAYAPSYAAFWDYYDVAWPLINDPGYVRMDRAMQMETRVYQMKDGKLLWSGLSKTMNPDSARAFVADVAQTVAADLRRQHVIQ